VKFAEAKDASAHIFYGFQGEPKKIKTAGLL
jgi:hypothetical protein